MIAPDLLELLVCPLCKKPLAAHPDGMPAEITGLQCTQCRRLYPVRDGIPIMLIDEAILEA
ncbi:MAG: Trm112 family protein [Acidobacteria bacterium]|jgi:uncharacterized protein YbaR (Trm112 family)|nr:Trm112 family protein [Acidobacteriota bacterium]